MRIRLTECKSPLCQYIAALIWSTRIEPGNTYNVYSETADGYKAKTTEKTLSGSQKKLLFLHLQVPDLHDRIGFHRITGSIMIEA